MKEARHLAQLNVGRLRAEPGDPAVAEFMGALDRVNGIGKRSPGFVWMMEGSGEPGTGNTDAKIDGDPRHVFNLTVWTDVESLEHFVWNTVHRQFYRRRKAWFEVLDEPHFVMWWVPVGHRPSQPEALEKLGRLQREGPSEEAFDWAWLEAAQLWRRHQCAEPAAS